MSERVLDFSSASSWPIRKRRESLIKLILPRHDFYHNPRVNLCFFLRVLSLLERLRAELLRERYSDHHFLIISSKPSSKSHIFSNLKIKGRELWTLESNNKGMWFEWGVERAYWKVKGNAIFHDVETRNLSSLVKLGESLLLNQV